MLIIDTNDGVVSGEADRGIDQSVVIPSMYSFDTTSRCDQGAEQPYYPTIADSLNC